MITREWKCRVPENKYKQFIPYLYSTGIEDAMKVNGFLGYLIKKKQIDNVVEVVLETYWNDIESVKVFAGEHYSSAKLYPEDSEYELDSDTCVNHYDLVEMKDDMMHQQLKMKNNIL